MAENAAAVKPKAQNQGISLGPEKKEPDRAESVKPVSSKPINYRDNMLSLRGESFVGPEDYEIGPLQYRSDNRDVRAVTERVYALASDLKEGRMPLEHLHPDWRTVAERSLEHHLSLEQVPTAVRIGTVEIYAGDKARANIRLWGNPGRTEGEIYLEMFEGLWLVSDLQADLTALSVEMQEREESFEPSYFRFFDMP